MKYSTGKYILVKYTLAILGVIILVSILVGFIVSRRQIDYLLAIHTEFYPNYINSIVERHPEITGHFIEGTVYEGDDPIIEAFTEDLTSLTEIYGVMLWALDGTIIWCSDTRMISKNFEDDQFFRKALEGEPVYTSRQGIPGSGGDDYSGGKAHGTEKTISIFVPLFSGEKIIGVIEVLELEEHLMEVVQENSRFIWLFVIIGGFLLYASLFYFFYQSYRSQRVMYDHLNQTQDVTIYALGYQAELRDSETGRHIERTSAYVKIIAQELQNDDEYKQYLSDEYIEDLAKSAPLHDIGKVGIPDTILLKPGRLTDIEFVIMQKHCEYGSDILRKAEDRLKFQSFLNIAMLLCRSHHEKWDGTGYPDKLKGNNIPLSARIMAIADVYDALRSKRRYKESFTHEKCVEIIQNERGKHFDPKIVDAFLKQEKAFSRISEEMKD